MILNFCPQCASPLSKISLMEYVCEQKHTYWNDVRTTAAVVLFKDGQILFSKRGRNPNKGMYDLPGGFLDYGESVVEAAIREMDEEAGLDLTASKLTILTTYGGEYFENEALCDVIVLVDHWFGTPVAQDDSEALEWKPIEFLDSAEFAPDYTGLSQQLRWFLNTANDTETN